MKKHIAKTMKDNSNVISFSDKKNQKVIEGIGNKIQDFIIGLGHDAVRTSDEPPLLTTIRSLMKRKKSSNIRDEEKLLIIDRLEFLYWITTTKMQRQIREEFPEFKKRGTHKRLI